MEGCNCTDCCFNNSGECDKFLCMARERTNSPSVYFKKLEKSGEPYGCMDGNIYQGYKATPPFFIRDVTYIETINGFAIKIK